MSSVNVVILSGNLVQDPELRYTPSGTAVTTFRLAVNRSFRTQSGEMKDEVCFIDVVSWGRQAETCGEYLSKGSPVLVEGRLTSRSWEAEDGQKRTKYEVVATRVQFLGRPKVDRV